MGTFTKTHILGRVGQDPKIDTLANTGDLVAKFSVATSDRWKDKESGEQKERTEWHNIVVRDQGLIEHIIEPYVRTGGQVHIVGENETRSWEKDGVKHYRTEIVLRPYRGDSLTLADTQVQQSQDRDARTNGTTRNDRRDHSPR